MLFRIIWVAIIGTSFLIAIIAERRKDKKRRDELQQFLMATISQKPFSVTEYLDRMEREFLKIADKSDKYLIVLWWGFDGLRLNEDGTAEWISRKPAPPPQIDYSLCSRPAMYSGLQNAICNTESMQAQIQCLQAQQLQALQSIQIQNMISSISPDPFPPYPTQCCITPYVTSPYLSWNCCSTVGQSSTLA